LRDGLAVDDHLQRYSPVNSRYCLNFLINHCRSRSRGTEVFSDRDCGRD
jgi:hypothetical protein